MYTIKCDAMNFKLNKSHKKILKRMNKFLRDGIKDKHNDDDNNHHEAGLGESQEQKPSKEHSQVKIDGINTSSLEQSRESKPKTPVPLKKENENGIDKDKEKKTSVASLTSESDKPSNPKKAKLIRLERKKKKLAAKGQTLDVLEMKKAGIAEKSLEDFLNEEPKDGKHRLEVRRTLQACQVLNDKFNFLFR